MKSILTVGCILIVLMGILFAVTYQCWIQNQDAAEHKRRRKR